MKSGSKLYNRPVMKDLQRAIRGKKCLLFIDLEGTQATHEMIEIGAYKVLLKPDLTTKKVFKPYHAYVQAKHKVGPIVTKITGITDLQLKREGIPFRLVLQQIKKYMGKDYDDALLVSYGVQDAHIILQSAENNMDASTDEARFLARRFFDLAEFIGHYLRSEEGNILSLTNALKAYDIEFAGTAHNAQDDAYNLYLLFNAFVEHPEKTLVHYRNAIAYQNHLPGPIRKVLSQLKNGKAVTPEDLDRFLSESIE